MGKPTGFLEYKRESAGDREISERLKDYQEFHLHLPLENQRLQGARCMNCGVPFCQNGEMIRGMVSGCPLKNRIPEWNEMLYRGNIAKAYERLHATSSFPEFTSRVCPALCEAACTCSIDGDAVSTRENEFTIIENAFAMGLVQPRVPSVRTGKKVAVIGSGPSGLAAADALNLRGHEVTVLEKNESFGGLLMYGIPNMKLDKSIVERRIDLMKREGVSFVSGANVGVNVTMDELLQKFDRILVCAGSGEARKIPAQEGKDNVLMAVDYLSAQTKLLRNEITEEKASESSAQGKHVVIVGGGDTGNDCVATALRQGALSVKQLEMMPEAPAVRGEDNPWPEWPRVRKTDYGQEEAIFLQGEDPREYCVTVKEVGNGIITTVKLDWKKNAEGRTVSEIVEGSEKEIPCDLLIIAAGFTGCESYLTKEMGLQVERGRIVTNTYRTENERVYAAGDCRRGQSLVVWAIKEGREAAAAIDKDLMGYTNLR